MGACGLDDELVPAQHPLRMVMALVEVAGRNATDPPLLVGLWLYACIRGIGSAGELARRSEESVAFRWLCGGDGESPAAVGFSRGPRGGAG